MRITQVHRNITKLLDLQSMKKLDDLAVYNPSPITLGHLIRFGKTASEPESFDFMRREIPIRMANIMKEINLLPSNLLGMPSLMLIQEWYAQSFIELCAFDGRSKDRIDLREFVKVLEEINTRHSNVVQTLAQAVLELKDSHAIDVQTENSIQYFLDRFYMSRISTRLLVNQHATLFGKEEDQLNVSNIVGIIDTKCDIQKTVKWAFQTASELCEEYYFCSPALNVEIENASNHSCNVDEQNEKNVQVGYPTMHLYHILYEIFKNAMRATVEFKKKNQFDLPEIGVLISQGDHDISIRISDRGGGIPRHITDNLFRYLYSTAPRPSMFSEKTPLAGYGYGLPLSRLYARYFHGDLVLNSYEGYGTDAIIYLKAHEEEAKELLPVFNRTSSKQYKAAVPAADWTDPCSTMNRQYHPEYQAWAEQKI